jgi:hypothetical protein
MNNFPPCDTADRETSGGVHKQEQSTKDASDDSALSAGFSKVSYGAKRGVLQLNRRAGKKPLPAKARAYHAKLAAIRKMPGNCGRCGKPNANGRKQCDNCRAYSAAYKAGKRIVQAKEALNKNPILLTALIRRIESLEATVAKIDLWKEYTGTKVRTYNRRMAQLKRRKAEAVARYDAMPRMSMQELATMSHAYGTNENE